MGLNSLTNRNFILLICSSEVISENTFIEVNRFQLRFYEVNETVKAKVMENLRACGC